MALFLREQLEYVFPIDDNLEKQHCISHMHRTSCLHAQIQCVASNLSLLKIYLHKYYIYVDIDHELMKYVYSVWYLNKMQ